MKKLLSLILVVLLCVGYMPIMADDYTYSSWAEEYCKSAIEFGWVSGIPNDFTKEITREEFCVIARKLMDSYITVFFEKAENPFTDTESDHVMYLYGLGIIKGRSETEFKPQDFITREEAAVIITRMVDYFNENEISDIKGKAETDMLYADDGEISLWAKSAVYNMAKLNIMHGTDQGFEPKGSFTIEQSIATFVRVYNLIENKEDSFADKMNEKMPRDENYVFSPLSIKLALALSANGADEETQEEIMRLLDIEDMDNFNSFVEELIKSYLKDEDITLNIANSVWINKSNVNDDFSESFLNIAEKNYSAQSGSVTSNNAPQIINSWVKEKTNNKIDSIINENNTDFWAMIINAIYFNACWQNEFPERATSPDLFTNADGTVREVDFMNKTAYYEYGETDKSRIIKLPYGKKTKLDISMYVALSDSDISLENELDDVSFTRKRVALSMPKFEIEYGESIKKVIESLGVVKAFSNDFVLDKILKSEPLKIDEVLHKAYIKVDEKGTEAAAVTAVGMVGATAVREEPIIFKADKPFCFAIRDNNNGEILFMGRYAYAE